MNRGWTLQSRVRLKGGSLRPIRARHCILWIQCGPKVTRYLNQQALPAQFPESDLAPEIRRPRNVDADPITPMKLDDRRGGIVKLIPARLKSLESSRSRLKGAPPARRSAGPGACALDPLVGRGSTALHRIGHDARLLEHAPRLCTRPVHPEPTDAPDQVTIPEPAPQSQHHRSRRSRHPFVAEKPSLRLLPNIGQYATRR